MTQGTLIAGPIHGLVHAKHGQNAGNKKQIPLKSNTTTPIIGMNTGTALNNVKHGDPGAPPPPIIIHPMKLSGPGGIVNPKLHNNKSGMATTVLRKRPTNILAPTSGIVTILNNILSRPVVLGRPAPRKWGAVPAVIALKPNSPE